MYASSRRTVRLRTTLTWLAVTLVAAGLAAVALPSALAAAGSVRAGEASFDDLLVGGCAVAAVVAAGWLWVVTTDVAVAVLRAPMAGVRRPGPLRALLLAACGVVALSGTASASPAAIHPLAAVAEREPGPRDRSVIGPESLAGLPLPDRATSDATGHRPVERDHRVRPGDSLWAIAEQRLGPHAAVADLVAYWHRTYDLNAEVIGPDPDLILPGQLLHLPPTA